MKKIFGFMLAASLLLVCACEQRATVDHFKEYEFVGTANVEQRDQILAGLESNVASLNVVKSKSETYTKSGSTDLYEKTESTITIYEDSAKPDLYMSITNSSTEASTDSNGISMKVKSKTETTVWDAGTSYRFTTSKKTQNKEVTETSSVYSLEGINSKDYKESSIRSMISLPSSSTIFLNEDGSYTCVYQSEINKNISAVAWGNGTKEYITSSKVQEAYSISKDYRLTNYYYYKESKSNRDPNTGEWYKSEHLISSTYSAKKYEYGKRESKSIDSLNNSVTNKVFPMNAYITSYSVPFTQPTTTSYAFDETNPTENTINLSNSSSTNNIFKYEFNSRIQASDYGYVNGEYTDYYYAQRYELVFTSLKGVSNPNTQRVKLTLSSSYVNTSTNTNFAVVEMNNNVYAVNKALYSSMTVTINFTFNGTTALIDRVYA